MEILMIVIEYVLIASLQLLGVFFHVMEKVSKLGDKYPEKSRDEIVAIFKKEDWDTVYISMGVVALHLIGHLSVDLYAPELRSGIDYYMLWDLGLALFGGYAGQRMLYKVFGTAEKVLNKKADSFQ